MPDSITRELGLSGRQVEAVLTTVEQRIEDLKNILLLYGGQYNVSATSAEDVEKSFSGKNILFVERDMPLISTPVVALTSMGASVTRKPLLGDEDFSGDYDAIFFRPESSEQADTIAGFLHEEATSMNQIKTNFICILSPFLAKNVPAELADLKWVRTISPPFTLKELIDALDN